MYNACLNEVKANFTKILSEVKLWVKGAQVCIIWYRFPEIYRQQILASRGIFDGYFNV